ncbi:hypothetical protein PF003_g30268 [Phytophthora fragariae]|nr:hypothetical protein PF003_g30268 [Phytophthora fragariae]
MVHSTLWLNYFAVRSSLSLCLSLHPSQEQVSPSYNASSVCTSAGCCRHSRQC